jgi:hypothetical protein
MKPKIYFSKLVLEALKRQMENGGLVKNHPLIGRFGPFIL